ncbi:MAG: DUF1697 domain-containing protein [Pseudomonadota bacterium]
MQTYLALLGSINIGGNRIKMVDLKEALAKEGFTEVTTVAASGNVILTSDSKPAMLETQLEGIVEREFGFKSCAMVRTKAQVESAIHDNPFHGTGPEHGSDKMVHSIFLSAQPSQEAFDALLEEHKNKGSERLALGDRVLFLDYVHGVGVSDLSSKFLERRLRVKGTARNMNSLKNILAKMG